MRLRNSVSSASGTFTRNGRIAFLSAACRLLCWGANDAAVVRGSRSRRDAIPGVISIWSVVFILCCFVEAFVFCRFCFTASGYSLFPFVQNSAHIDNSENSTQNGQPPER